MVIMDAVEPSHDVTMRASIVHFLIEPVHILVIPEAFRGPNFAENTNYTV